MPSNFLAAVFDEPLESRNVRGRKALDGFVQVWHSIMLVHEGIRERHFGPGFLKGIVARRRRIVKATPYIASL